MPLARQADFVKCVDILYFCHLLPSRQVLREDPDLAAAAARGGAAKDGSADGPGRRCAKAADAEDASDELFYYHLEHAGDASKAGSLGAGVGGDEVVEAVRKVATDGQVNSNLSERSNQNSANC